MRLSVGIVLIAAAGSVLAQSRKAPPTFDPGDTEGLVMSPNPRIRTAWKRKVYWTVSWNESRGNFRGRIAPQTPAERQAMTAKLEALVGIFKASPTGSAGEGFWVKDARTLDYFNPFALPAHIALARFPLEFTTGLFPQYHEDVQDSTGKWKPSPGETESVYYYFNRLPETVGQPVIAAEAARGADFEPVTFYLRPRVTARLAGYPVYEQKILAVTRSGRDPWVPAPLGRVLKAALPSYEKDRRAAEDRLANYKKRNEEVQSAAWEQQMRERFEKNNGALRTTRPSNYEARLRSLEHEIAYSRQKAAAEASPPREASGAWYWNPVDAFEEASKRLAALSPAEASRPACFQEAKSTQLKEGRYALAGAILAVGSTQDCREIVATNWDYYDLTLPRAAPQILTVVDFGRCAKVEGERIISAPVTRFDTPPQGCVQHAQMWREVDWSKIAALVHP